MDKKSSRGCLAEQSKMNALMLMLAPSSDPVFYDLPALESEMTFLNFWLFSKALRRSLLR